jgi:hypothetical protein
MVNFTTAALYPLGKRSRYPLDVRLCGPRNRSGCLYRDSNSNILAIQPLASHYIDFAIPALKKSLRISSISVEIRAEHLLFTNL